MMSLCCLLPLIAACPAAPVPEEIVARRVSGCYRITPGPWQSDSARIETWWTSQVPKEFELLNSPSVPSDSPWPEYQARAVRRPDDLTLSTWRIVDARRQELLIWRGGMQPAGLEIKATFDDSGFTGLVTAFTDAVIDGEPAVISRRASGRRIPCPAP